MRAHSNTKLSIVFSFRNEEEVLSELITRCRNVLNADSIKKTFSSYELIFVNDASSDNSLNILVEESKKNNDIKIINMSRCFGISPCALAGMQHADGDAVVYMDADLQDPPEVIPQMVDALINDPETEVVHTIRKSRKGEPLIKKFITKIGYSILQKTTSFKLTPETGDFKLLSKKAVNELVKLKEKKPFLRGLVCWIGFKQTSITYDRQARYAGKTKCPVFSWRVINNFMESALISFSSLPLQMATWIGLITIAVDFFLLIHIIHEKMIGKAVPGWAAIMVTILFFGSVQLLCLGIVGIYLNSIYQETKKRPSFIIDNTFGFENNSPSSS